MCQQLRCDKSRKELDAGEASLREAVKRRKEEEVCQEVALAEARQGLETLAVETLGAEVSGGVVVGCGEWVGIDGWMMELL